MLEIRQLSAIRDERILFENLNFNVSPGDLLHLLGPNGAGKTTLLRIIAGLGLPESGEVYWKSQSIKSHREDFHQDLLFLGHHSGVKRELSAFENLAFYQKMHGALDEDRIWNALACAGLLGYEEVLASQLSAGQHRRIALARLWITEALLWILDEPLTAIDKEGVRVLETVLQKHVNNNGMVIFTTHQDMFIENTKLKRIFLGE